MDVMSQSPKGGENAVIACGLAIKFYAQKAEQAKTEDDDCLYSLYLGSSAERYGSILSRTPNQDGSKKYYNYGDGILEYVISHCPDEPHIVAGAKGVLHASQALR